MPKLILKFGPAIIKEYTLLPTQTIISIGRKPENDIIIDNPIVSGKHAQIIRQGDVFFIEDLNSTNGTFIGGRKILKSGLTSGDEITIGTHTITFIDENQKQTQTPAAQKPAGVDQTMVMDASMKEHLLKKTSPATDITTGGKTVEKVGTLVVTSGSLEKSEFELTGLVTYIGKSENAHIKIKGLFVPEMAAAINKRQEGYVLVALKDKYPEVNGNKLTGQIMLQDGDELKTGSVTFRFYLKEVIK